MAPVVVLRPLSGYANRLQAIISSTLVADDLGAELVVCWDESPVAPVPASAVLDPGWCGTYVRSASVVEGRFGVDPTRIAPHLTVDTANRRITLAGLDLGEQHFMPACRDALAGMPDVEVLVLSAGGKFTLDGDAVLTPEQQRRFRRRRSAAYAGLALNPDIEARAAQAADARPYVGLHLRYSDRSTQTPWPRDVAPAVAACASSQGTRSVFVASDTSAQRRTWTSRLQSMGLEPWSADPGDYPRSDPRSALGALVDWRLLTRSQAMVYFGASSFAEEAAVASGRFDESVGLTASANRTAWVRAGQYLEAARTYPRRHGWWGDIS